MNPEQVNQKQTEETNPIEVADDGYVPRERGLLRRDLLLDAASDLFSRYGYESASLQEVVSRAGGSMATLYRMFGNKEGLFQAVIERKSSNLLEVLNLPNIKGEDPHKVLFNVGMNFLNMVLSDEALSLHRILIAESGRNPRLREIFMAVAPERSQRVLGDYLQAMVAEGKLQIDDSYLAAIQFINMIKGNYHMRRLLGEEVVVDDATRRREVTQAVKVFLEGTLV